jgi:hypothetical protein
MGGNLLSENLNAVWINPAVISQIQTQTERVNNPVGVGLSSNMQARNWDFEENTSPCTPPYSRRAGVSLAGLPRAMSPSSLGIEVVKSRFE